MDFVTYSGIFVFFYYFCTTLASFQRFWAIFKYFLQIFENLCQFDMLFCEIFYFGVFLVFLVLSAIFLHNWNNFHAKLVWKCSAGNGITLPIVKRRIMKLYPCIMLMPSNVTHLKWSSQVRNFGFFQIISTYGFCDSVWYFLFYLLFLL